MICIQIQPDDLVTLRFLFNRPLKSALAMRKDIEASKHETKPVLEYEAAMGNRVGPMPPRLGNPLIRTFFFGWETRYFWGSGPLRFFWKLLDSYKQWSFLKQLATQDEEEQNLKQRRGGKRPLFWKRDNFGFMLPEVILPLWEDLYLTNKEQHRKIINLSDTVDVSVFFAPLPYR